MSKALIAAAACVALAGAASAQTAEPSWGERLRMDAQAVHDILKENHPGAVDPQNPAFYRTLETGLRRALKRAETAATAAEWNWALREYGASFDDGHLNVGANKDVGLKPVWPGFITAYQGEDQVVVARAGDSGPPMGARLISCDGIPAAQLAERSVGRFHGRWALSSQRTAHGWRVFANSSPYAPRPDRCRFEIDGVVRTYPLAWRGISNEALQPYLQKLPQAFRAETGLRRLPDGTVWIAIGSFATRPGDTEKLQALVEAAKADAQAIRAAPRVVFDVRGNDGGSSQWADDLAELLWGEAYVRHRLSGRGATGVEWRVSDANIEHARALKKQMEVRGSDSAFGDQLIAGLTEAKSKGLPYWRQGFSRPAAAPPAPSLTDARVFVLTDGACFSACLDALDVWKAAGAVQVGQETSADTLYMENRGQALPSGLAGIGLPVKVYRGRKRGNNETHRPAFVFDGDISDTAAVERWIAALPATPARS